ncbi:MAG: hypothetical protein VZR37_00490, partial [Bifidobacterium merycicum]|nr:hypothetical protein [Bifidobacterium merycicum]
PGFQSRFFVLANENRTQDAGHALLRQGRNPKVRKNSGVIIVKEEILVSPLTISIIASPRPFWVRLHDKAASISLQSAFLFKLVRAHHKKLYGAESSLNGGGLDAQSHETKQKGRFR